MTVPCRLCIAVDGFWGASKERAYLDLRVSNPFALSNNVSLCLQGTKLRGMEKDSSYGERVREVEHASFTPLVLSATCRRMGQRGICFLQASGILVVR